MGGAMLTVQAMTELVEALSYKPEVVSLIPDGVD